MQRFTSWGQEKFKVCVDPWNLTPDPGFGLHCSV